MEATGVFQPWGLFAPNPMTTEVRTFARVTFEDGTSTIWSPSIERGNIDSNRNERWRKWEGRLRQDTHADLWDDAARHVAARYEAEASAVTTVDLVRRWSEIPWYDREPDGRLYQQFVFFRWDSTTDSGRELTVDDQPLRRRGGR